MPSNSHHSPAVRSGSQFCSSQDVTSAVTSSLVRRAVSVIGPVQRNLTARSSWQMLRCRASRLAAEEGDEAVGRGAAVGRVTFRGEAPGPQLVVDDLVTGFEGCVRYCGRQVFALPGGARQVPRVGGRVEEIDAGEH